MAKIYTINGNIGTIDGKIQTNGMALSDSIGDGLKNIYKFQDKILTTGGIIRNDYEEPTPPVPP